MLVTIITDASFCPNTCAAGYGVWVASDRGRGTFGGPLQGVTDSGEAEIKAACNGLHHAISNGYVMRGDRILIQLDCMPAISVLSRKCKPRHKEVEALEWIERIASSNGLTLLFRHVKGHNKNCAKPRTLAQTKCDETAYMYMKMERGKALCGGLKQQINNAAPKKPKKVVKTDDRENAEYWKRKFRELLVNTTSFRMRNN